ncbi:UDP-Glycosyltransferase/glycogen phosphorylase [Westerdykella ornata]|uniref:UDP-Glycosyltransferase/glycogen phosphorylase n=1 Tax=Westerdykella ornata TaxID=318751 RepID=A0A6A6JIE0_WESOR|nr:UDP-Glycosyltransferase/glycogen phosphorylase [Westerdykella ornata]KAF2275406.1 UDP-Glycosyltransferase/glycogen phosphorylase [Westerdykella ornata]
MCTDITPHRPPMLRHSQTEAPRPKARRISFSIKRDKPLDKPRHQGRRPTLTFEPYSSDSSCSSGEDEPTPPSRQHSGQEGKPRRTTGPFSRFHIHHDDFHTKGHISKQDGRLKLHINETVNRGYFAKTLGAGLKRRLNKDESVEDEKSSVSWQDEEGRKILPKHDDMEDPRRRVKLNIVVIVIGSRGDIQPFLRIGKILKEDYGHRVRIATHPAFKKFVEEDSGLEFFSVGGNPSELMAFMVKNPGLIPSIDTIKEGEVGRRRAAMYEMFQGMWRACINSTDDEGDYANLKMMGHKDPFVADAIIANPPSFAPPHIAERLGIPLHMMFTFPYTPTVHFPHPLANIKPGNVDPKYTNFMSYPLVEMMTWQGLGDLINRFRAKTLFLNEVSTLWAPGQLYRLKVPYTYLWSPGLVPKPKDWGPEIDISGFVFLDLASSFKPPDDLMKFLEAGEPPVYIGFGSIVVDDPDRFTKMIFEAVKMAGVRALVSKGWGGLGGKDIAPDYIFMLDNTPHDWLFPRVSAVVHHGGAGTTAIGLKCAKPTMIVPFFGDQPFWGGMVAKAKAGAHECIPYKKLTAEKLAEGIKQCLTEEARKNVQQIADSIAAEGDGALNAVRSFHRSLPLKGVNNMRCHILQNRCAAWRLKNTTLRLSPLAAELLVEWKKVKWNELRLLRIFEWNDFGGPGEPLTGAWGAIMGTADDIVKGVGLAPLKMAKSVKKRRRYYTYRFRLKKRQKHAQATLEAAKGEHPKDNQLTNDSGTTTPRGPRHSHSFPARPHRNESSLSRVSQPEELLAEELAQEAGHGLKKAFGGIIRAPMYFTLALAQGFHNVPRLYGDETVRRPHRITGFHSGLRASRDEFLYGIHDGITGVWRQPIHGAREGGAMGFLRGVGHGIGGLVHKDIAAFIGPPAYIMKGLDEERKKKYQPTKFIRRSRILQGRKELARLGPPLKAKGASDNNEAARRRKEVEMEVNRRWEAMESRIQAEKKHHKDGIRAVLLGRSKGNDGKAVPRKVVIAAGGQSNRQANGGPHPKKSATLPIKKVERHDSDGENRKVARSDTAPGAAFGWKGGKRRRSKRLFEGLPTSVREEVKEGALRREE